MVRPKQDALISQSCAFLQAGRFKPIFSILAIKVVGFTPRSSAAPSTPLIFDRGRDDDSGRPSLRTGQANFWQLPASTGAISQQRPETGSSGDQAPDTRKPAF